jgi:hypothetical protein
MVRVKWRSSAITATQARLAIVLTLAASIFFDLMMIYSVKTTQVTEQFADHHELLTRSVGDTVGNKQR